MKTSTLHLALALFLADAALGQNNGILVHATSSTYTIRTNAVAGGGGVGATSASANGFYYALFAANYDANPGLTSTDPLNPVFQYVAMITNNAAPGGIGSPTRVIIGSVFGAPTDSTYTSAERNYYLIAGWSANLGNSWGTVAASLASGWTAQSWTGDAFFGVSALANGYSGGGPFNLPAPNIFGVTAGMPGGLTSGWDLNLIPEPSAFALLGCGAGLIAWRRLRSRFPLR